MKLPFQKTKEGITIHVRVQPRSSRRGIGGVVGDTVKVNLTAPPVDGAANEQLIEVLSEELGIARSCIRIARGLSSRQKVVVIKDLDGV